MQLESNRSTRGAGNKGVSALESDLPAMRAYMRVCIGIAHPVQPDGSGIVAPFELADWTAGAGCAVIGVGRTASGGRRQACRRSA
jgi:hypothetical protein